jgi:hypothetical protein
MLNDIPYFATLDNFEWKQNDNLAILTFPPPPPRPSRKTNQTPADLSDLNCSYRQDIKLWKCKTATSNCCLPVVFLQHKKGTAYYGHVPSVEAYGSWAVNASDGFWAWAWREKARWRYYGKKVRTSKQASILPALYIQYCIARALDAATEDKASERQTALLVSHSRDVCLLRQFIHRFVPT